MDAIDANEDAVCKIVDSTAHLSLGTQQGKQIPAVSGQVESLGAARKAFSTTQKLDTAVLAAAQADQVISPLVSSEHNLVPFNDPMQTPFHFETPLFKGKALLLLRNMPNTPTGVFEGKRRQMVLTVQGQFKQPDVQFDSLMLGSDFVRPLKLPARALLSQAIQWVANKLGGGVSVNVDAKQPYILAPLIAAAQVVHVAQPGQQLDLRAPHEDMRLYDPRLGNLWTGKPWTAKQRRAHFSAAVNRQGRTFDCNHVWTFQLYEHVLDYSTFLLNLPFFRLDMVQLFDGQPLQLMIRDRSSGRSLLHLTLWHRRMLAHPANSSTSTPARTSSDVAVQPDVGSAGSGAATC